MTTREFRFSNGRGHTLSGRLELPSEAPAHFAVFAHCFTCSKDIAAASRISRALAASGLGVLRFDFTGLGNSDGDFANQNFSSNVGDLVAAAAALRKELKAPSLLVGHSLGGAAVLAAAGEIPEVSGVVTIGAPADPAHVKHLLTDDIAEIEAQGRAQVSLAGRVFTIEKQFLDDLEQQRMDERVRKMGKALLIFHSPHDEIVPVDEARRIYERALHPKSFVSLDGADHLLSNRRDSEYVGSVIAAWASRYLPPQQSDEIDGVRVETLSGKFAQQVSAGRHRLVSDEPEDVGGSDLGPGPYDLLLAGLGACTSMTLSLYAARKQWPLEKVTVDLEHGRVHAADCEECAEGRTGKVERVVRTLRVEGPLTDEQRTRLVEIANKCPVHRTLTSDLNIVTTLEE